MAKIAIYAHNVIGKSMTGPAIRAWEFAKVLSQEHEVVLLSPNQSDLKGKDFALLYQKDPAKKRQIKNVDIMITQTLGVCLAFKAKYNDTKIILDAYDPIPLEFLEFFKKHPIKLRNEQNRLSLLRLAFNFEMADGILCSCEKQRDLWLGLLMGQGRITPTIYDRDNSLRNLINVVPFGLSSIPPKKTGPGLREKYGFRPTDKVLLWGGGIWNWFDPISLIKAIHLLNPDRADIKLVFMGIKNPEQTIPEMEMCNQAIRLAQDLRLMNKAVFFNPDWVPYEERQNFLLDADIGVSTHSDHLETRYAFRTRMLDYIWAQLPILATTGDSFAELIERHHLGIVVPYQNERALAQAISSLVDNPQQIKSIKNNLASMQKQFCWESVTEPMRTMIHDLTHLPSVDRYNKSFRAFPKFVGQYMIRKIQTRGLTYCLNLTLKKMLNFFKNKL